MKKREFKKKLTIKKISISNLVTVKGGWQDNGDSVEPCTLKDR